MSSSRETNEPNLVDQEATRLNNGFLSTFQRKRRHLFRVDLKIERVVSLPYANGKFFFKIRLLNGGHHIHNCPNRVEVNENKVEFNSNDHFIVKMSSRVDNFTLEHCFCRISIRKEGRAGRSYEKIGFYDLDLASYAGCGDEYKACLLNGYQQTNTNPANAYLEIRMKIAIVDGDHIFRRPNEEDEQSSKTKNVEIKSLGCEEASRTTVNNETLSINSSRGHSRQASKSSVCSHNSLQSNQPSMQREKSSSKINSTRTNSDDDLTHQQQKKSGIEKRRSPFIDQFGDIEKRLQSTRVDVQQIVDAILHDNQKQNDDTACLCLLYNDDGTTRLTSSSTGQSIQSHM